MFTDGVKVDHTVVTPKPVKSALVVRKIKAETIGGEMASRIMGTILLDVDDLYCPKTQQFLTEEDLRAKGAVITTVKYNKILCFATKDTVKKGRTTGNEVPFIRKEYSMQMLLNVNWGSYINRRNDGDTTFVPSDKRSNGVTNFENCKAVGKTKAENFTLNGVCFKVLTDVCYYDENGNKYSDEKMAFLTSEYLKVQSKASKQKEADKHGIDVKFDPKYRTVRIDNCETVRCFGFEFRATEHINNR